MADVDPSTFLRSEKSAGDGPVFDAKKWLWVPDDTEGFVAATIKEQKGDNVVLELTNGSDVSMDINDTCQMNPPKFEKIEDMASLTYLNEATVLHDLRQRYYSSLIYTYSGLFCVAVNPYRRLPIYTNKVVDMYKGKRRTEMPPHIYSISDNAYRDMLQDRENQSILITGESGAGKTENTKKVIQYFASIAPPTATGRQEDPKRKNLEEQVIQTNPVLEAFGNAKTIRNDNSSRFGKFIRIHFGNQGKIAGADIEYYLLEKSRVISQQPGERCYHIFYQLLAGADDEMLDSLLLSRQVKSYHFVENGEVAVDNLDDAEEYIATNEAMLTLGMEADEIAALFKTVAGILHFGNIEVKQRPREEWATIPTTTDAEKVSHLLGINSVDLIKSLIKPRIRVGTEYVQQGRNMEQCVYSIGALAKSLYERMFAWLVKRVNKTLDTKARKNFFIGVLDIAGFEIFTVNSFEQLCINYTNERLQQFFNHHMFVQEQEEYRKEGINWDFIDFGLDLQSTIDLIEKPMGILSLLDEESLFPKASDATYVEKLLKTHDGKSVSFSKPNFKTRGSVVHFEVGHYAGTVGYTVIGWLNKNKDPLNDSVVELFRKSTDPFIAALWSDYQSKDQDTKRKKGSQFVTMAQLHKTSLGNLMTTLRNTIPHFVRCIIPNELKKPGLIDAHLVLHQLRCNGVLEGIRICRKGFPNRLIYQEFRQRYAILAPKAIPAGFMDGRKACEQLLSALALEVNEYRLGNSKVFFRAGVLGRLEDMRDERLGKVLTQLQAYARGFCMRRAYRKLLDQRLAIAVLQRNIHKYLFLRNWKWWRLYTKVKPLLNVARSEDELRQKEEELNKLREKIIKEEQARREMDEQQTSLLTEKNELFIQLQREQDQCSEAEENVQRLMAKKAELESNIQELSERLDEEVENNANIGATRRKLEAEIDHLQENLEDMQNQMSAMEQEKNQKERDCQGLEGELEKVNDNLGRAHKEKKALEERIEELTNSLQGEEDKANRLAKAKAKLENTIAETNDELEREKRLRGDVEKVKRKLEADLKATQDTVDHLNHSKMELEKHVSSKEKEITELLQNAEDNASEIASLQKKVRELEARIEELEEDLENERNARTRFEKQKNNLLRELEDLKIQLEEQGGATASQIDMNRKREAELVQLRMDMTGQAEEHEKAVADLRKKQVNAVGELEEQMVALQKSKSKLEKDIHRVNAELMDTSGQLEDSEKVKSSVSRKLAQVEDQFGEASSRLAEYEVTNSALQASKSKLQSENNELSAQLGEAESKNGSLSKINSNLTAQLDETKSELEMEVTAKLDAQSKLRTAQADVAQLQESLDEEQAAKSSLSKQLAAAKNDAMMWKSKMEGEASLKIEELEEAKRKLQKKLKDADESYTELGTKYSSLEKAKNHIAAEMEDLNLDLEKEHNKSQSLEKKQKQIDKQITEWKSKCDSKETELDQSKKELHMAGTELLNMRSQFEDLEDTLAASQKDKKRLQGELSDLEKQLSEGGMSVHELEKSKKKLEGEKEELTTALEEAETHLENEEARLLRVQLELTQLKQEMERRLNEKEDEIESARKNQQRQLEALQHSLDAEVKAKNDQVKQRKLVEGQTDEMQAHIDEIEKALNDSLKKYKGSQAQLKELNVLYEEEQKLREEQHDISTRAEKRANDLNLEVEEVKAQLEQLQRSYRTCDAEKTEAQERVQELQASTSTLQSAKRKAEQALATLQEEHEELETECQENGEKLRKTVEQSGRFQSELVANKNKMHGLEKAKNSLDTQVKELSSRLDEEVANANKAAKREAAKLQARISEIENEAADEAKAKSDAQRALKKSESKVKEFQRQLEEEKSNGQRLQDQVNQLSGKMRSLRREKESAESEAEGLLKKVKQAKAMAEDAEETSAMLQAQISKLRAAARRKPVSVQADDDDDA